MVEILQKLCFIEQLRVFGVHMKDEEKQEKKSHNVVIGSGHLDVLGLFKALKKVSFLNSAKTSSLL